MDKKKWIKHIPLFILELIVLIAAAGALYVVLRTTGKNGVKKDRIDTEHIAVNEEVKEKIQDLDCHEMELLLVLSFSIRKHCSHSAAKTAIAYITA